MPDTKKNSELDSKSNQPQDLSPERRALLAQLLQKKARSETSTVNAGSSASFTMQPNPADRFVPFPLTDIQQAYWIGRSGEIDMGLVASHAYIEIENELYIERLERAWNQLIERHDMLRAVFLPDGHQKVLEEVPPYVVRIEDLSGLPKDRIDGRLEEIRHELSHHVLPSETWPLFDLQVTRLDDNRCRLHVSLDALIFDGWSLSLLFREWAALYENPDEALPPISISFRDYVLAEAELEKSNEYSQARDYWIKRVQTLPPGPELPLAKNPSALHEGRFTRRERTIEEAKWTKLKIRATEIGVTSTGLLIAAYAEVLSLWSSSQNFSLNIPSFNRLPFHEEVDRLIGEIASFSVLEIDNTGAHSFVDRAKNIQQQLWDDLDNRLFSGIRVLREWAQSHAQMSGSIAPVVFTVSAQDKEGRDAYPTVAASLLGDVVFSINQTSQVWIDNHIFEHNGNLVCHWDSVDELFPDGLSETILNAFLRLLDLLATNDEIWELTWHGVVSELVKHDEIRIAVLEGREASIPELLLHDLFAQKATEQPGKPALVTKDRTFTYGELFDLSNQWARLLRSLGAKPNKLVAIVMEKGWEQVVAAIGVLTSGAAYIPIDVEMPASRRTYMLENGEVDVILTQSWLDEKLEWPEGATRFSVDTHNIDEFDTQSLGPIQSPDDLAFVLYTSGSTGMPKGAMIAHRGLVNSVIETNKAFDIGSDDRVVGLTALHHDMSVFDIFGVLGAGGSLVLPDANGRRDPAHWAELISGNGVTLWNSVPAMMDMLLEYAESRTDTSLNTLRITFLGGDWIPLSVPERLNHHAPNATVVSVGGPTETTLWNIWYVVDQVSPEWKSIPYGAPIANTTYKILNEAMVPCPTWVAGEMCVAGPGVAKGYWRDEEMTATKFVTDPATGERLYRTGDRGCLLPDGNIEFLGRMDSQVKIDGQRIELGEIEAVLNRHTRIKSSVVTVVGERTGKKTLVAYLITGDGVSIESNELSDFVSRHVPSYMVPSDYVQLDQFPLNRNGKIDRLALPTPKQDRRPERVDSESLNRIEIQIADLVADVVGLENLDIRENLLSLGVNSLDMVRIANALENQLGFRPRIDELFRLQTIQALAEYYEAKTDLSPKLDTSVGEIMPSHVKNMLESYTVILDPGARDAFRATRPGVRTDLDKAPSISLDRPEKNDEYISKFDLRRSYRTFSLKPVSFHDFGKFLSSLSQTILDGQQKFQYATPGGLNPTQVYFHVKSGRIEGVEGGAYYYHPEKHQLILLTPDFDLERSIHIPFINVPIFDECAFSVFLIADLDAIGPAYGEPSLHFVTLEAGIISHHLEMSGPDCEIGLCQIGSLEFDRIREHFLLKEAHVLIHSLLGGRIIYDQGGRVVASPTKEQTVEGQATSLLDRIKDLSKEELSGILKASTKNQ